MGLRHVTSSESNKTSVIIENEQGNTNYYAQLLQLIMLSLDPNKFLEYDSRFVLLYL